MNIKPYLVVEGRVDELILRRLLPDDAIQAIEIVVAHGSYSAQSLATTLLEVRRRPLALVVDADTTNPAAVQERIDLLRYLVRQAAGNVPYAVFVAVPEIEVVLLHDRSLFEHMVGQQLSDLEWRLAQLSPKEAIGNLAGSSLGVEGILSRLTDEDVNVLRQHALIKGLKDFLANHIDWVETATSAYTRVPALSIAEAGVVYQTQENSSA